MSQALHASTVSQAAGLGTTIERAIRLARPNGGELCYVGLRMIVLSGGNSTRAEHG